MDKILSSGIKVAIFRSQYYKDLEEEINKFMEESDVLVYDIKFSSSQSFSDHFEERYTDTEVMVIYRG